MPSRRDALRTLGNFAALPFLGSMGVDQLVEVGRRAHEVAEQRRSGTLGKPRALTQAQYEMVVVAAEHIIPRTSTAGATDTKVADFIDVMLADWYSAAERELFTTGLAELDAHARKSGAGSFVRLAARRQIELLAYFDIERENQRTARPGTSEHWFGMLKRLTAWGYYTSRPGMIDELRVQLTPGRYDGNAPY